jgi:hypothetical protein
VIGGHERQGSSKTLQHHRTFKGFFLLCLSFRLGQTSSYPNDFASEFSPFGPQGHPETWAGLCRLNRASLGFDSQLPRGNTVGHANQFGIIWKAALYAGFGPATVEMFQDLWRRQVKEEIK